MSLFDLSVFSRGGPVMWLMLGLSLAGLVVFMERMLYLHRAQIRSTAFLNGIKNILAKKRLMEAITVCEETPGPVAAVVKAALLNHEADESKLRLAVQEAALVELPILERRLGVFAALAQVAPLLGLLGTAVGLIKTFNAYSAGGNYATPVSLSGGMWEALLTTAAGLAIAVPAHLAFHFLQARVRAIVRDIEWVANDVMRYLLHDLRQGGSGEATVSVKPDAPAGPAKS